MSDAAFSPADRAEAWTVACLCAGWCRACESFRPIFEQHAAATPQAAHRWVDIEDDADSIGDLDIETFPTLLIARGGTPLFFGPVLPQATSISKLLASLGTDGRARTLQDADLLAPLLTHLGCVGSD
jgi:thioredoxin 1